MDKDIICIVGSGIMGRGIAYVAVLGGYRVHLVDVSEDQIKKATDEIERSLDAGRARGKVDDDAAKSALERIVPFTDLHQGSASAFCVN